MRTSATDLVETAIPGTPAALQSSPVLPLWRRAALWGTGFGIAIGNRNLEAAIVRARPSGASLLGTITLADFRARPAAEWGAELLRFLAGAGEHRLAATILLPRDEVIVRIVSLPGVADKDVPAALELQVETLHPWGDVEISYGWSRVGRDEVMAGLARKDVLDSYETSFAEAGIAMAAATFSPAVIHAALRAWSLAPASLLCFSFQPDPAPRTEVYGESESRPLFSATFPLPAERALAISRAELRIAPDHPAMDLSEALPAPSGGNPASSPLAYAAAIAGAATRSSVLANLLPPERRASHNRLQYVVPASLAILLLLTLVAVFAIIPAMEQKRYRAELEAATRKLEPAALRAQSLERQIGSNRLKIAALDEFRGRPQADLEVLNELTRLLPPPIWASAVEIFPDFVIISGEADQAAPLIKVLDSSPLFQNSEFTLSVARVNQAEQFRIKTMRRGRLGRVTP